MEIPSAYLCPITQDLMRDPVIAQDGFSYEREAITKWFLVGRKTSPITNNTLECTYVFPNRTLKTSISEFVERRRALLRERLIHEIGKLQTNKALSSDHPLFQCSLSSVSDSVLDAFAVLQAVLYTWKQDPEVCKAALEGLVRILDHGCASGCGAVTAAADGNDHDAAGAGEEVAQVADHGERDAARLAHLGVFPVVMDLLLRYESHGAMQGSGLRYIQHYAKAHGSLKTAAIHILRAYEIVGSAMRCHPLLRDVQLEGAKAVEILGMNLPSHSLRLGIPKTLTTAVHHFPDDKEMVVAVCSALIELTAGACARLCQGGFCRRLVEAMIMFPKSHTLQLMCCLTLGKISHSKAHCDDAPCDVVTLCLHEFIEDDDMVIAACAALSRLAAVTRSAFRIGVMGGCELVLKALERALEEQKRDMVRASLRALNMLTAEDKTNRQLLASAGHPTYALLVDALTHFSTEEKVVLSGMRCLFSLSYQNPSFARLATNDCRAPQTVVQCMRSHLASEDIQTVGWWCLEVMAKTATMTEGELAIMALGSGSNPNH